MTPRRTAGLAAGLLLAAATYFPSPSIIASVSLMTSATCSSVGPAAGNVHRFATRIRL